MVYNKIPPVPTHIKLHDMKILLHSTKRNQEIEGIKKCDGTMILRGNMNLKGTIKLIGNQEIGSNKEIKRPDSRSFSYTV